MLSLDPEVSFKVYARRVRFLFSWGCLAAPLPGEHRLANDAGQQEFPRFRYSAVIGVVAFLALLGTAIALGGDAIIKDVTFTSTTGRILLIIGVWFIALGFFSAWFADVFPCRQHAEHLGATTRGCDEPHHLAAASPKFGRWPETSSTIASLERCMSEL